MADPEFADSGELPSFDLAPFQVDLDADGFVVGLNADDVAGIRAHFEKHGVVVVNDVLDTDEVQASHDEVWQFLREYHDKIDADDPSTWLFGWPSMSKYGILGNQPVVSPQALRNRQNPKIHRAFAACLQDNELVVSLSRFGLMRPTKQVRWGPSRRSAPPGAAAAALPAEEDAGPPVEYKDMERWKTQDKWLHFDINPLSGRVATFGYRATEAHLRISPSAPAAWTGSVQGILSFVDVRSEDGGFHCVPGFHHHLQEWVKHHQGRCASGHRTPDTTTVQLPVNDPARQWSQRFPMRAGALLIWDARLPHGNYPNDSDRYRMVQYLKMNPVRDPQLAPAFHTAAEYGWDPEQFSPTPLGRRLLGLDPWHDGQARAYPKCLGESLSDSAVRMHIELAEMREMERKRDEDAKSGPTAPGPWWCPVL